ncbi:MAG TPA: thiol-disulfide isomerase [Blastocatellia bacterium]|nr:thiol-disulfide isomerase [Blastocatellia bacterium]
MRKMTIVSSVTLILAGFCLFTLPATNANGNAKAAKNVTFNKDVAPIFFKSCAECHRAGEIAPMSLMTYKDARPWAKSIREKVVERVMPPWHADPHYGTFRNDRRLSQQEIDTIVAWVDEGAKEGEAKDLPPAPTFTEGWNIGKPDETFSIPEQSVPADGVIKYQYFVVPTNFKEDRWISRAEIRSTGRSAVHHVIVFIKEPGAASGVEGRLLAGVAPGEQPAIFPTGYSKKIPAGSQLVFQMHYTPNGKATKDVTTIGLVYAKEPVKHEIVTRPVLQTKFVIPAGDPNYEVKSSFLFNRDAHITSLMPHMHLRGKDFIFRAIYPDGTSKILLSVPKYDFGWQTYYLPTEPIAVPKGTRIECVAHFDNSPGNKYNPDPTKEVRWGDQTWEEMMIGWLGCYFDDATPTTSKPAASATGDK